MSTRRFGPWVLAVTLLGGLGAGVGLTALVLRRPAPTATSGTADTAHVHTTYVCPMHPSITSDRPGECPICGMQLVPANAPPAQASGAAGGRKLLFYRSPMDPKVTSPTPRKDEMGMDFVPVYSDEVGGAGTSAATGLATVGIDPQRQQLIGLRTAPVVEGPVGGSWRTVGRVAVDETRVHHVALRFSGFIEQVFVDYVGKPVRSGEPLFSIYSPDVASAEEEYLLALRTRDSLGTGAAQAGEELVTAARERLKLWDIPEAEVRRLERTRKARRTVTLYTPMSGVVTKKDAVMGHRVAEGDMPYEITDLSQVWFLADAYESDLARVKLGMPATLTLQAFPGKEFTGKVIFIDPILDPKTRTAKVRLAFPNPTGELRPEMFGEVTLRTPARKGLSISTDAIIDSGTRKVVFVSLGEGKFRPQEVKIGATDGDRSEVLAGLKAGDEVVTRANFLVDSESRLRASLGALEGAGK